MLLLHLQAAELAEYSMKITLLEEAKRSKEEEAESWHSKVSFQNRHQTPDRKQELPSRDVFHSEGMKKVPQQLCQRRSFLCYLL